MCQGERGWDDCKVDAFWCAVLCATPGVVHFEIKHVNPRCGLREGREIKIAPRNLDILQ